MAAPEAAQRRGRRTLLLTAWLVAATGLLLVAVAHTGLGQPLLALLPSSAGCPISIDAQPARVEAYRIEQLGRRQGTQRPLGHPALSFELGKTTRADVMAWTERRASCRFIRQGHALRCQSVEPTTTGELIIADLYAQFDGTGRLVALDLFREATDAATALRILGETARRLEAAVGPSTARATPTQNALQRPMSRVSAEYRYAGYIARLSATHLGKLGIVVREQYQWASSGT